MKNLGKSFTFLFEDPDWVSKTLTGTIFVVLSIIFIGIPVLYGYCIELLRRVRNNDRYPLPEWNEVGVKFITGIKYLIVLFVYYIPLAVLMIPVVFFVFLSSLTDSFFLDAFGNFTLMFVIFVVAIPYSLLITWLTPIIAIEYCKRESIGDALNIGRVFKRFKLNWQEALIVALIALLTELLSAIGIIFLIIGVFVTSFYASIVKFYLFGQIDNEKHELSSL